MPLLNYTSKVPPERTASEIMATLSRKGATHIMMEYGDAGEPIGLRWRTVGPQGPVEFALPINAEAVFRVLTKQKVMPGNAESRRKQAGRTAWRIVKEWVDAQMALIETEMADMEEVFLPYMLVHGEKTLYQAFLEGRLRALDAGEMPPALDAPRK